MGLNTCTHHLCLSAPGVSQDIEHKLHLTILGTWHTDTYEAWDTVLGQVLTSDSVQKKQGGTRLRNLVQPIGTADWGKGGRLPESLVSGSECLGLHDHSHHSILWRQTDVLPSVMSPAVADSAQPTQGKTPV